MYSYSNDKPDTSGCLYFINVVATDDAAGKINLDGVPSVFSRLAGSGYSYAQVNIKRGSHFIESTEPGKGFVAWAYNYWDKEARSYPIGFEHTISFDLLRLTA